MSISKSLKRLLPLGLALVVSLSLQLATISKWSVWHDEGYTAMLIDYSPSELLRRTGYDVHPPAYYLLLKAWAGVVGHSDVALRSLSVICMLATIVVTYRLVRRCYGERSARWSLLPLAIAPTLVRYGQEMRMYALAALVGVSASYILMGLLQGSYVGRKRHLYRAVYVALAILLLYIHYFAALLLAVHWCVVWAAGRDEGKGWLASLRQLLLGRQWRWWLVANAIVVLAFIPWLPRFIDQLNGVNAGFWIPTINGQSFLGTLSTFVLFRPVWVHWSLEGWTAALALLTAAIVLVVYRAFWQTSRSSVNRTLIIGYFTVPAIILFILSLPPLTPVYYDRYMVTFAPLFYAGLGIGLGTLYGKFRRQPLANAQRLFIGLSSIGLLASGLVTAQIYGNNFGHYPNEYYEMKPLVQSWRGLYQPGDTIIVQHLGQYFNARFYMKSFAGEPLLYVDKAPDRHGNTSLIYDRFDLHINQLGTHRFSGRVWLVTDITADDFLQRVIPSDWQQFSQQTAGESMITGYRP